MADALTHTPLLALGLVLVFGALLGGGAERLRIPWITGCVLAGILLGPSAAGLLHGATLAALGSVAQLAVAVIAFNVGCQLALARLRATGGSILLLAAAQLVAPALIVLAGEALLGMALATALILAAVAPSAPPSAAVLNEAASLLLGAGLGLAWLGLLRLLEGGGPGWEARLLASLGGVLLLGIGGAIGFGLSHLLVPLGIGAAIANGLDEAGRERVRALIHALEDPLFIIFFVLAGAHLPLAGAGHLGLLLAALAYVAGRFAGKYGAVYLAATALRLDGPTRRWLGLCFPSQGGLAMGAVLALKGSAAVQALPPAAAKGVEDAISVVLIGVLASQLAGPVLIDLAVRRGCAAVPRGG